jgi:hypothetical protein
VSVDPIVDAETVRRFYDMQRARVKVTRAMMTAVLTLRAVQAAPRSLSTPRARRSWHAKSRASMALKATPERVGDHTGPLAGGQPSSAGRPEPGPSTTASTVAGGLDLQPGREERWVRVRHFVYYAREAGACARVRALRASPRHLLGHLGRELEVGVLPVDAVEVEAEPVR